MTLPWVEWAYRFIFLFFVLTLEESLGFWHGVDVGQIGRKQKAGFLSLVLVVSALIDLMFSVKDLGN